MGMEKQTKKPWYGNTLLVILLLIIFFPVGLFLMWKYSRWNIVVKGLVTGVFLLITVSLFSGSSKTKEGFEAGKNQGSTSTSPTLAESKTDIVVTSQIIKKIDKKYRYFFDIRNNGQEDFRGTVKIELFNKSFKSSLVDEEFSASTAYIAPSVGKSVYIDAITGPVSEHGEENGYSRFTFTVKDGGNVVKQGEGTITDSFEDTDL